MKNTENKQKNFDYLIEWFQDQAEFTTAFECMSTEEMNKCLSKFYVSARKQDGNYYKKTSLLSIRAALDRHLKTPPYNKRFSICDNVLFSEANKTLNSYLKQLVKNGKIAPTVHKVSLTADIVKKLYEKRELADVDTQSPRALLQTAWFLISIYFGKRGRENQSSLKKSMLRLVKTADGQEYFELNRSEPGAVLTSKNHTGGLHGSEDHSDGKIFSQPGSKRCPVEILKTYLIHLNPNISALFQKPKSESSAKFNPKVHEVWYDACNVGHNTLENMLRKMTERAGITPYLTNHSLRATTVTVLSGSNIETRQIKAITGHKSNSSIESYCERPTLGQYKEMSTALTSFIHSDRSPESRSKSLDLSKEKHGHSATITTPMSSTSTPSSRQDLQSTDHENFFTSLGLNSGSILPSGSFNNCHFTFNVNMNTR